MATAWVLQIYMQQVMINRLEFEIERDETRRGSAVGNMHFVLMCDVEYRKYFRSVRYITLPQNYQYCLHILFLLQSK